MEDSIETEVEALVAIFGEDLRVSNGASPKQRELALDVPLGAVRCTGWEGAGLSETMWAEVCISTGVDGRRVRVGRIGGLSESESEALSKALDAAAEDASNSLYDVFAAAEAFMESVAEPELSCPVCLLRFRRRGRTVLTPCSHHFHPSCLSSCLRHQREEICKAKVDLPPHLEGSVEETLRCPLCRGPVGEALSEDPPDGVSAIEEEKEEDITSQPDLTLWRRHQDQLSELYARQLANGGIIDVEEERQRGRVDEDTRLSLPPPPPPPPQQQSAAKAEPGPSAPSNNPNNSHHRHRHHRNRKHRPKKPPASQQGNNSRAQQPNPPPSSTTTRPPLTKL